MKTIALKVTSAFLVGGKIAKVGDVVEVSEADAKSLLHRGKAVLATTQPEQQAPEGMKPTGVVLTEGDAAADLAGEPRPDHQDQSSWEPEQPAAPEQPKAKAKKAK